MIVIEGPQELQELQTSPEQPPAQSEEAIETLEPSQVLEYAQEPVYVYEPEDAQEPVNTQESAFKSEYISTIQDQHDGDPGEALSEKPPIVEHIAVFPSASSFDTIYSTDQVETPNWGAVVESEQRSSVQAGHKHAPIKRNKGFWRTMLAFLFHV